MKKSAPFSVDLYIEVFDKEIQSRLKQIRNAIRSSFPDVEERISYQMPAYTFNGVTVYFSAYKHHIGLYPIYGSASNKEVVEKYRGKNTKDSLHFKHSDTLPIDLIIELVKQKFDHPPRKKQ
jgi:uncharacterized protein YdhG (YjbR/CyaY superfamily)